MQKSAGTIRFGYICDESDCESSVMNHRIAEKWRYQNGVRERYIGILEVL